MALALTDDVRKLIDGPNFAHLATIMPDGSPQSAPVWVTREGDLILVGTGEGSLKAKNTRRDPRVALSIVDFGDPYVEAQIRGRVVERRPDPKFVVKDATARKYTGKDFPWRNPDGFTLVIAVDRATVTRAGTNLISDISWRVELDERWVVLGPNGAGKTGTAEYDNNPADTHAWTIGWRGDIAFAVFVEKGGSSSATAVPIVAAFLKAF